MRSACVQISLRRIGIARILLLAPFVVLGIRAAHLSVDERGIARGENQTQRATKKKDCRSRIRSASFCRFQPRIGASFAAATAMSSIEEGLA